jgi:hypoxanthine phosphoribosyltransferase
MKLIKLSLLIFVVCGLLYSSCKKSNSNSPSVTPSFSLKVNGVSKSTNTITTNYSKSTNVLQVEGVFNTGEMLSITINNVKAGTFDIAAGAAVADYLISNATVDSYAGTVGTVTISSFTNSSVTGSFQFTGTNLTSTSIAITAGTFQANHQ